MNTTRLAVYLAAAMALVGPEAVSSPMPTATVRVALVQMTAVNGALSGNLAKMDAYAGQAAAAGAKICVFPEWCDLGSSGASLVQPIPGSTTAAIGSMARTHGLWIVAAIWEKVPTGVYDALVIFNDQGELLIKQRKQFVGGIFDGGPAYNGNYHDAQLVPSPWGPLGGMICADMYGVPRRMLFAGLKPALMFAVLSNPPADLPAYVNSLAVECGCPAVGVNQVWPGGIQGGSGGRSIVVSETGTTLWQAGNTAEVLKTWDLTLNPGNLPPAVDAGDVQTIRLPASQVMLSGYATDDGLPGGTLTTTWSKLSGPGTVTFGNTGALSTTATFSAAGVYVLRLTASDGALSRSDDVSVNVLPTTGDLNLVGYWPFDGTAADQSGSGNNGFLVGAPVYSTDVAPTGGTNTHSIDLTLAKGYVQVPHSATLNGTQAVTLSLWIKPRVSFPGFKGNGGNSWAQFVKKGNTWGQANYLFGFGAYYYAYAEGVGCSRVAYLDDAVLTPGVWYHVAAVLDSNKNRGKIYLNGTLDQTFFFGDYAPLTNGDPLLIGSQNVDSLIDDVRLYTRALCDAEIAALAPGSVVNQPPAVNAGPDVSVALPAAATLQGSYTDDGVPATSAVARFTIWRKVSGPGDVQFANRFTPSTSATFSMPGAYVLELVGSDGAHRRSDTVRITVDPAPTLSTVTAAGAGPSGGGSHGSGGCGATGLEVVLLLALSLASRRRP
jgi:predicted amidohydrolase